MALDPLKRRLDLQQIAFLDLGQDGLDQVFVLDRLARRVFPSVLAPVDVPHRQAVDRVAAVGDDAHVAVAGHDLERSENGRELCALVGLSDSWQGFGDVSGDGWMG